MKEAVLLGFYFKNLNLLGIAYSRTREYKQAIDILLVVIYESPDTDEFIFAKATAHSNLSNSYKRRGKYVEAINALEESLIFVELSNQERIPETLVFRYFSFAQMLLLIYELEEALNTYRQIVQFFGRRSFSSRIISWCFIT